MSFFKIFNLIYKLTRKNGFKVFIISILIFLGGLFLGFNNQAYALTPGNSNEFDLTYDDFNYLNLGWAPNSNGGYTPGSLRYLYVPYITLNGDNTITFNASKNSHVFAVALNDNYAYLLKKEQVKTQRIALINSFSELPDSTNNTKNIPVTNLFLSKDFYFLGSNNFLLIQVSDDSDFNNLTLGISKEPVQVLFGGSSGGGSGGGSSADYSSVLNQIYTDVHTIAGAVQNSSNNDVVSAIDNTSSQTQNVITSTSEQTQNLITNQTQQSQQQYDTFMNTTQYDNSVVNIDSASYEVQDVNGVDNFLDAFYTLIYNFFDTLQTDVAMTITVPIPFTNESFVLSTASIQQFYANNVALANLITGLWWLILGRYIIGLSITIFNWCSNGLILKDTDKLAKELNDRNVIIKDLMM